METNPNNDKYSNLYEKLKEMAGEMKTVDKKLKQLNGKIYLTKEEKDEAARLISNYRNLEAAFFKGTNYLTETAGNSIIN